MFTGIVQGHCRVVDVEELTGMRRLTTELGPLAAGLELGASVAHNGTCLTATSVDEDARLARFDVVSETLEVTNLGRVRAGDWVNVERSMRAGDEIGGHEVSGHVSTTGVVADIERSENNQRTWIEVDAAWMPYLPYKGFVALDGASLTISHLDADRPRFAVSLIPETRERTTFGHHEVGDTVNVEIDARTQVIVDTIRRLLADPDALARIAGSAPAAGG